MILSGPSGAGKSTVVRRLLETCPVPLEMSVSATTRPARPGERDGIEYHFLSKEEFARRRRAGAFIECCEVFGKGYWYGTLREAVTSRLAAGTWVLLEIDVDGATTVLKEYPQAITVFLSPGTMEELERRLRGRGTETEETIRRRLEVARREMTFAKRYTHRVVNDSVDRAAENISEILVRSGDSTTCSTS